MYGIHNFPFLIVMYYEQLTVFCKALFVKDVGNALLSRCHYVSKYEKSHFEAIRSLLFSFHVCVHTGTFVP